MSESTAQEPQLSPRQRDVLILAGKGCSDEEIGRLLDLTKHTVVSYMREIRQRLDVETRVEAAVWAAKQGWL